MQIRDEYNAVKDLPTLPPRDSNAAPSANGGDKLGLPPVSQSATEVAAGRPLNLLLIFYFINLCTIKS
jgi:hypothetical protein